MPRAPSPGRPRQGRRCARARCDRPPARTAGRPRANGRGPRSPSEPAADAAVAGGPARPTGRPDAETRGGVASADSKAATSNGQSKRQAMYAR
eukprot:scaffold27129_cov76-Phaeocystis_antarctica.AAC.3